MKAINLRSLIVAKETLSPSLLQRMIETFEIDIKRHELEDLKILVDAIYEKGTITPLHHFFVGFRIEQISKEFDLLRVSDECVVNIELKWQNTGEKMERQLRQNRYYLNSLDRDLYLFTFVSTERALYRLNGERYERVPLEELITILNRQRHLLDADIQELFSPTKYLVSPFNQIGPFLNAHYFLTSQQQQFKDIVLEHIGTGKKGRILAIEGEAGTGKTLLTYDIAKHYDFHEKKHVHIIHCGLLNKGHRRLQEVGFRIDSIYTINWDDLYEADIIIIDEAQRMHPEDVHRLLAYAEVNAINLLFSYDPTQYIGRDEAMFKNEETFAQRTTYERPLKLTGRIRSNREIISFVKKLFNRKHPGPIETYDNIEFQYFTTIEDAEQFVKLKERTGWKFIDYTVPQANGTDIQQMSLNFERNSHQVIGQEFDKVIIIIGEAVRYNTNGRLVDSEFTSNYSAARMIHQNMTRAREALHIVILNNVEILETCVTLLQSDRL